MTITEGMKQVLQEAEDKLQDQYFSTLKKIDQWETNWPELLKDSVYLSYEKPRVKNEKMYELIKTKVEISMKLKAIDTTLRPPKNTHHNESKEKTSKEIDKQNQDTDETAGKTRTRTKQQVKSDCPGNAEASAEKEKEIAAEKAAAEERNKKLLEKIKHHMDAIAYIAKQKSEEASLKRLQSQPTERSRHTLKTRTDHFDDLWNGRKTFEIRKADRSFFIQDKIILQEVDVAGMKPSGRELSVRITGIHDESKYGVMMPGYLILSLEIISKSNSENRLEPLPRFPYGGANTGCDQDLPPAPAYECSNYQP